MKKNNEGLLKLINLKLKDIWEQNLQDYQFYINRLCEGAIQIDLLFFLFIGRCINEDSENELMHSFKQKAIEKILSKQLKAISIENSYVILREHILKWVLFIFNLEGADPCLNMKKFLNEFCKFHKYIPSLIADVIKTDSEIQFCLKACRNGDSSLFKGPTVMEAVNRSSLACKYKDIYLNSGNAKKSEDRHDHLKKILVKKLQDLAKSTKLK